jgi:hypothetical protein
VRVTAHQFRHTLGTRMINNEVSLDVVQRMLDHGSPEMTARYATIKDQTLRREWERFQQRINVRGELIPLPDAAVMSDAAWAASANTRKKHSARRGTKNSRHSRVSRPSTTIPWNLRTPPRVRSASGRRRSAPLPLVVSMKEGGLSMALVSGCG